MIRLFITRLLAMAIVAGLAVAPAGAVQAALIVAAIGCASTSAFADITDYRFELVE